MRVHQAAFYALVLFFMSAKLTTILLADDHAVVRRGFSMILAAQWDMQVLAEVSNGREAVAKAGELQPDVVVMDVTMPELNGIEATRRLLKLSPKTRVLSAKVVPPRTTGALGNAFNSRCRSWSNS